MLSVAIVSFCPFPLGALLASCACLFEMIATSIGISVCHMYRVLLVVANCFRWRLTQDFIIWLSVLRMLSSHQFSDFPVTNPLWCHYGIHSRPIGNAPHRRPPRSALPHVIIWIICRNFLRVNCSVSWATLCDATECRLVFIMITVRHQVACEITSISRFWRELVSWLKPSTIKLNDSVYTIWYVGSICLMRRRLAAQMWLYASLIQIWPTSRMSR